MKKYTRSILIFLVILGIGYGVGRYTTPEKVRTEVVEKEVIKKDVVTIIKEVINKDGSKSTETIITDKSKTESNSSSTNEIVYNKKQWQANVLVGLQDLKMQQPVYGVMVQKRFMGPFFLGAYGNNNKEAGLTIGFEF